MPIDLRYRLKLQYLIAPRDRVFRGAAYPVFCSNATLMLVCPSRRDRRKHKRDG